MYIYFWYKKNKYLLYYRIVFNYKECNIKFYEVYKIKVRFLYLILYKNEFVFLFIFDEEIKKVLFSYILKVV